jgi:AP-4 complex subunit mu-1
MGSVVLDDCNFHECVDLRDFEAMKTLSITPPDGEFLVMNYRINGEFPAPFRIYPFIDESN